MQVDDCLENLRRFTPGLTPASGRDEIFSANQQQMLSPLHISVFENSYQVEKEALVSLKQREQPSVMDIDEQAVRIA
jgi:hypothetical protein